MFVFGARSRVRAGLAAIKHKALKRFGYEAAVDDPLFSEYHTAVLRLERFLTSSRNCAEQLHNSVTATQACATAGSAALADFVSEDTDAAFDSALFVHAVSVLEVDRVQRLRDSLTQRLQRLSDLKDRLHDREVKRVEFESASERLEAKRAKQGQTAAVAQEEDELAQRKRVLDQLTSQLLDELTTLYKQRLVLVADVALELQRCMQEHATLVAAGLTPSIENLSQGRHETEALPPPELVYEDAAATDATDASAAAVAAADSAAADSAAAAPASSAAATAPPDVSNVELAAAEEVVTEVSAHSPVLVSDAVAAAETVQAAGEAAEGTTDADATAAAGTGADGEADASGEADTGAVATHTDAEAGAAGDRGSEEGEEEGAWFGAQQRE